MTRPKAEYVDSTLHRSHAAETAAPQPMRTRAEVPMNANALFMTVSVARVLQSRSLIEESFDPCPRSLIYCPRTPGCATLRFGPGLLLVASTGSCALNSSVRERAKRLGLGGLRGAFAWG
jgi:hypothetical protein